MGELGSIIAPTTTRRPPTGPQRAPKLGKTSAHKTAPRPPTGSEQAPKTTRAPPRAPKEAP
eukprot:5243291-Pyramimonas_sp.AAC.1